MLNFEQLKDVLKKTIRIKKNTNNVFLNTKVKNF